MSALQKTKKEKTLKKLRNKTIEEVLDCTEQCSGYPYSCLDCMEGEEIWKE